MNYFDGETCEKKTIKGYSLLNSFMLARIDFYLVEYGPNYMICLIKDNELYSVWRHSKKDYLPNEAISDFRKGFLKNNITMDNINLLIDNPKEFKKQLKKKPED